MIQVSIYCSEEFNIKIIDSTKETTSGTFNKFHIKSLKYEMDRCLERVHNLFIKLLSNPDLCLECSGVAIDNLDDSQRRTYQIFPVDPQAKLKIFAYLAYQISCLTTPQYFSQSFCGSIPFEMYFYREAISHSIGDQILAFYKTLGPEFFENG